MCGYMRLGQHDPFRKWLIHLTNVGDEITIVARWEGAEVTCHDVCTRLRRILRAAVSGCGPLYIFLAKDSIQEAKYARETRKSADYPGLQRDQCENTGKRRISSSRSRGCIDVHGLSI